MANIFEDNSVKRMVQKILFNRIKVNSMVGLGGPNAEEYYKICSKHADCVHLCDTMVYPNVEQCSLICAFEKYPSSWVDADFCSSILGNGIDLYYIYNKLKITRSKFTVTFTVAIRGISLNDTIKKIEEIFQISSKPREVEEVRQWPGTKKYIHIYKHIDNLDLILYRSSGENMLAGKVVVSNNTETLTEISSKKSPKLPGKNRIPFNERLNEFRSFIENNHKLPTYSKDLSLYVWYRGNMYNPRKSNSSKVAAIIQILKENGINIK